MEDKIIFDREAKAFVINNTLLKQWHDLYGFDLVSRVLSDAAFWLTEKKKFKKNYYRFLLNWIKREAAKFPCPHCGKMINPYFAKQKKEVKEIKNYGLF
jgi:hypothetical protein